jgi:hypothetical protein
MMNKRRPSSRLLLLSSSFIGLHALFVVSFDERLCRKSKQQTPARPSYRRKPLSMKLLVRWVAENTQNTKTWSDKSNALRALIVHLFYAEDSITAALIVIFARCRNRLNVGRPPFHY